jgi:hypothetical protein
MDSHLDPEIEAAALCAFIKERVAEYESLQTQLEECVAALQPGPSGIPKVPLKDVDEIPEIPKVANCATAGIPVPEDVRYPAEFGLNDLDKEWSRTRP